MQKYNPSIHQRHSIRLQGYDYSQAGLYFITICAQDGAYLFGQVKNSRMELNAAGEMINNEWENLTLRFPNIKLHEYITMPNHFHGILEIVRATLVVAPHNEIQPCNVGQPPHTGQPQGIAPTIGNMMDAFKSITTVEYIRRVKNDNWPRFNGKLWQRNYYERIIRDEIAYQNISNYIINNPAKWQREKSNPHL